MSNFLFEKYPHLLKEWDYENNDVDPYTITCGSNKKVWWLCSKGHRWRACVYNRAKPNSTGCPYCSGNIVNQSNSLLHNAPIIAEQFYKKYNASLTASQVHINSNKKVWWKCEYSEDHIWKASPNDRAKEPGCPFCSGRRASKDNNLAILEPDLLQQWDYNANTVSPYELTRSSSKQVWWKCDKAWDHKWLASPNQRLTKHGPCPFCSGRKVCQSNCLATTHPHLLDEWDFKRNKISPQEITYSVHKKVWWVCKYGHSWQTLPYVRVQGKGCPKCRVSRGEEAVKAVLDKLGLKYEREYRFSELRKSRFDFAVFMDNIYLIEFHGIQHYKPVSWSKNQSPEKNLKMIQKRDQNKRNFAKNNNIPLLEIPYDKIEEVEVLISNFIFKSSKSSNEQQTNPQL